MKWIFGCCNGKLWLGNQTKLFSYFYDDEWFSVKCFQVNANTYFTIINLIRLMTNWEFLPGYTNTAKEWYCANASRDFLHHTSDKRLRWRVSSSKSPYCSRAGPYSHMASISWTTYFWKVFRLKLLQSMCLHQDSEVRAVYAAPTLKRAHKFSLQVHKHPTSIHSFSFFEHVETTASRKANGL